MYALKGITCTNKENSTNYALKNHIQFSPRNTHQGYCPLNISPFASKIYYIIAHYATFVNSFLKINGGNMKNVKNFFIETIILIATAVGWGIIKLFRYTCDYINSQNNNTNP